MRWFHKYSKSYNIHYEFWCRHSLCANINSWKCRWVDPRTLGDLSLRQYEKKLKNLISSILLTHWCHLLGQRKQTINHSSNDIWHGRFSRHRTQSISELVKYVTRERISLWRKTQFQELIIDEGSQQTGASSVKKKEKRMLIYV